MFSKKKEVLSTTTHSKSIGVKAFRLLLLFVATAAAAAVVTFGRLIKAKSSLAALVAGAGARVGVCLHQFILFLFFIFNPARNCIVLPNLIGGQHQLMLLMLMILLLIMLLLCPGGDHIATHVWLRRVAVLGDDDAHHRPRLALQLDRLRVAGVRLVGAQDAGEKSCRKAEDFFKEKRNRLVQLITEKQIQNKKAKLKTADLLLLFVQRYLR